MREILFRGKRVDNGEWVCGSLIQHRNGCRIEDYKPIVPYIYEVDPTTAGQYTNRKDNKGKMVFDGDEVQCCHGECYQGTYEHTNSFVVDTGNWEHLMELSECVDVFIIGNIHDKEVSK